MRHGQEWIKPRLRYRSIMIMSSIMRLRFRPKKWGERPVTLLDVFAT
jgi:hypothetical protein